MLAGLGSQEQHRPIGDKISASLPCLVEVINRRAFGWQMDIQVSWQALITAVLFSVGAAMLAGLYPAWRAARSQPALAMREE